MGFALNKQWWNPLKWKLGQRRYQGQHFIEECYSIGPFSLIVEVSL